MPILSSMLPVLSIDERYFLNDVRNGPSLVNSVHFPVSTVVQCPVSSVQPSPASVLSRAPCVRQCVHHCVHQCVREVPSDKSEVNRWTMVDYAAQLN